LAARQEASTKEVRFELGPVEMEFQVVARKEIGGDAKVGFHILAAEATLGGSGKGSDERTQKVKFVLNPIFVDASGQQTKVQVGRESPGEQSQTGHSLEWQP
jgi:hypothetical protein